MAANLHGDTIADFARGDRILIIDATPGPNLSWNGSMLTYGTTSITLTTLQNASITASAASGGGVQIAYGGPALIVSAGPSVAAPASAASQAAKSAFAAADPTPAVFDGPASALELQYFRMADDMFAIA